MSGTSVDGIDAVLIEISPTDAEQNRVQVRDHCFAAFEPSLADSIQELMTPGDNEIDRAGEVGIQLAHAYASIANRLIERNDNIAIDVIGCHGQTVRHRPDSDFPFTVQLGCGATIAAHTQHPVVCDFRAADIAHGGQGAPFAPFLHAELLGGKTENRVILNLGGIANVTLLPAAQSHNVLGFDTGPANVLMDLWHQSHHSSERFDRDGAWASSGTIDKDLLGKMLGDPYFARPAPKSTGREYFNAKWLDAFTEDINGLDAADVQATLAELTSLSVTRAVQNAMPDVSRVIVCGGGANNAHLLARMSSNLNVPIQGSDQFGVDPHHVEAMTFAYLAWRTLQRQASTMPSVTGADRSTVAGAIYFPAD